MPVYKTCVSMKVADDDVETAIADARQAAAEKLGCEPEALELSWRHWCDPKWVLTRWTWDVAEED